MKFMIINIIAMVVFGYWLESVGYSNEVSRICLYFGAACNIVGYVEGLIDMKRMCRPRLRSPI